jgi:outer membrane protein OmpA-like peptidoglycan-associated protein
MQESDAEIPSTVHEVLNSAGQSLDAQTRMFMESRFGYDFGKVRVHTDGRAAESAKALDALAYTSGSHIVFDNGQYAPATLEGQRLLAHELIHTLQQTQVSSRFGMNRERTFSQSELLNADRLNQPWISSSGNQMELIQREVNTISLGQPLLGIESLGPGVESIGPAVKQLQRLLNEFLGGPVLEEDGIFGQKTRQAVIEFQNRQGLVPDGIVGPKTGSALGAPPKPSDIPPRVKTDFAPLTPISAEKCPDGLDKCKQGKSFVNTSNTPFGPRELALIGSIFFCTDCFNLDSDNDVLELRKMKDFLPLLEGQKVKFHIRGLADVRGNDQHNLKLSENRAKSVDGFIRNLLISQIGNYDSQIESLGKRFSDPKLLEGFRRVDIFGPTPKKSRDWRAKMVGARSLTASPEGVSMGIGSFELLIDPFLEQKPILFQFTGKGIGLSITPFSISTASDCIPFQTVFALEVGDFEGEANWRTSQISVGVGASVDTVFLFGPRDKVGEPEIILQFKCLGICGLGIGAPTFFSGNLRPIDKETKQACV